MVSLKHKKLSGKADATDSTLVRPSAWNDEHDFKTTVDGVFLGRPAGAGPGDVQELPVASLRMPGEMVMWAGTTAPTGWMLCQGQSLVRADFPVLFGVIGTSYGAVDGSHFSLPDLRGRVPAGVDGSGRLTGATITNPHLPGGAGGQETAQYYADVSVSGGGRAYGASYGGGLAVHVEMDTWQTDGWGGASGGGPLVGSHTHHMAGDFAVGGTIAVYCDVSLTSSGGGYTRVGTNVQPTLMVNYIIKV